MSTGRSALALAAAVATAVTAVPAAAAVAADQAPSVIGPHGYGKLLLGMDEKAARATGLLNLDPEQRVEFGGCVLYPMRGVGGHEPVVVLSRKDGLISIEPFNTARTPEGVKAGATLRQVTAVYPKVRPESPRPSAYLAPAPGRADASYRFVFRPDGTFHGPGLRLNRYDCAR